MTFTGYKSADRKRTAWFNPVMRKRTAWHEAGHAVMALDMGVIIRTVSIVANKRNNGCLRYGLLPDSDLLNYQILIAGPLAEQWVASAEDVWSLAWGDQDQLDEIVRGYVVRGEWPDDPGELAGKRRALESLARKRMEELRPQVEKLARELLVRQTMTGTEIKELLNTSPPKDATASPATVISELNAAMPHKEIPCRETAAVHLRR